MTGLGLGGGLLLAAAAFVAGAINGAAGGGSLVSFPTLLLLGLQPLQANVSNTLGLLTGYLGGSTAYHRELHRQRQAILVLGGVSVAGAVAGAVILLHSGSAFQRVLPWLILASCAVLAAQPVLVRFLKIQRGDRRSLTNPALLGGELFAGAYGAFFGGGLGVLTLAVLGLFLRDDMQHQNALKGVLSFIINAVAGLVFAFFAPVAWDAVLVMLPGALLGGFAGGTLARHLSANVLRAIVVVFGVAVAIRLLV